MASEYNEKVFAFKHLMESSYTFSNRGNFQKAIKGWRDALEIAKDINDRKKEAAIYCLLGEAHYNLGDFRKAIELYEKALKICVENSEVASDYLGIVYYQLGCAHYGLGNFWKAIEFHEKALEIAKLAQEETAVIDCYTALGVDYHIIGDVDREIELLEEADRRTGAYANPIIYANLGNAYHSKGDFRTALRFQQTALRVAEMTGQINKMAKSVYYRSLGQAYHGLGEIRKAIKLYEKSLRLVKGIHNKPGEAICFGSLGDAYYSLGDFMEAIGLYQESLKIAKEIGHVNLERLDNLSLGRIYDEQLDTPDLAYHYYESSIKLFEIISGKVVGEEEKIGFFARTSDPYQYMVPLCLKLKTGKEAFNFAERSKSRAFLNLLAATEIKPSVKLTSKFKSLLNDEEPCLAKLREIQTRHLRQRGASVELGEAEKIFEELNNIYNKIEQIDPEYAFLRRGRPLSLTKIQDMLSSQKRGITLIEYFTTEEETFIFVVSSKDRELHIKTVPLSTVKLNRFLENYWREVVNHPSFGDIGDTWLGLSDYLIEPISEFLTEGELIYFVPYGLLHYLPMHALELRGEPLIRKHPVAYAPSASLIRFCQNKGSGELQRCASFGVVFEKEAEDIAQLFNTKVSIGPQVTKDEVCENCTDKDIIHFSCHGYFDNADPLSSGVELFDKVLTAREIFNMKLNTELVTLSACQTGLNERSPGDELIGLTRAFLYAGSPSVIVSLWSVDGRSTQELMLEFYTLLKDGKDKAVALQEAQKKIMQKEGYSHPYYWAPFVLVGDWALAR